MYNGVGAADKLVSASECSAFLAPPSASSQVLGGFHIRVISSIDPPLSDHDLAQRMIEHGLVCQGESEQQALEEFIGSIGYYRLEEYTWPYRLVLHSKQNKRSPRQKGELPKLDSYLWCSFSR